MNIKSQHKRNALPLSVFVTCTVLWLCLLGSVWAIFLPIPMGLSFAWWAIWNGDRVGKAFSEWVDRDGWR